MNADSYDENGNLVPIEYAGKTRGDRHQELIAYGIRGGIAQAHAKAYLELAPAVQLVAVADIDGDKARDAAAQWGVEQVFEDYRDLLALDTIDALSICTPTCAHSAPAIAALDAARPVVADQPAQTVRC